MMVVAFVSAYLLDVSAMIIIFVCLGIGLVDLYYNLRKNRAENPSVSNMPKSKNIKSKHVK